MRRIDTHPRQFWIGHQTGIEHFFFIVPIGLGEFFSESRVLLDVCGVFKLGFEHGRCRHCRAMTVSWVKTGKCKPCFIPQKHEVRFDRQAFFHHPFNVVHHTIKSAVGQQHHAHAIERAGFFVVQQGAFEFFDRYRAVH